MSEFIKEVVRYRGKDLEKLLDLHKETTFSEVTKGEKRELINAIVSTALWSHEYKENEEFFITASKALDENHTNINFKFQQAIKNKEDTNDKN